MTRSSPFTARGDAALKRFDGSLWDLLRREERRQRSQLEMIASENFVSPAVLAAMGSVLTNKYAEGLPGKRYYGGCEVVDRVEELAIERACTLFGCEEANVQPHSGSQANMAVYAACMKPGDVLMGLNLAHGGHLTHGHPVNFSGLLYRVVPYGVDRESETIDWDAFEELAHRERPKVIVAGGSAYPRSWDFESMRRVADEVGAFLMVDMAHFAGLVASGHHPSPIPWADAVTSTTHKTLRGPRGGLILFRERWARAINRSVFPGIQGGPLMHVIAAKAVAFGEAQQSAFKEYGARVVANARRLGETLAARGVRLVSGGTDNHLLLVDVRSQGLTGRQAEQALEEVGVTVNKNAVPFDEQPPAITSGIRIGTAALTTRGLQEADMEQIGEWIADRLHDVEGEDTRHRIQEAVLEFCTHLPLFAWEEGVPA